MSQEIYKIRRAIIIPLGVAVFFLFFLLFLSRLLKFLPGETFVLGAVFLFALYFFLEVLYRQVSIREDGLEIKKFLRKKELTWDEITHLGCLVMAKKVYFLLTTTKGFCILSNSYEQFPDMLDHLIGRMDRERVEGEVLDFARHPLEDNQTVRSAWFIVTIILAVIALRLFID
ncbi:MAG TPA: hypothetical protein VJZ49_05245 [Syntrophales bacterium]|nr:hypothetical protein [Syntrophales bacterium]